MEIEIINQTKARLISIKKIKAIIDFFKQTLIKKKVLKSKSAEKKSSSGVCFFFRD